MAIKRTESRIPAGYVPSDLGQAVAAKDAAGQVEYVLVSYLTSPIAVGSTINYVVFVCGVLLQQGEAYEYEWTIDGPTGATQPKRTKRGVFEYKAEQHGSIRVRVNIIVGGNVAQALILEQEVIPLSPGLEMLIEGGGLVKHLGVNSSVGALGGDEIASRELINNFRPYVFDVTESKDATKNIDVPTRLLAAITYAQILRVEKSGLLGRDAEINAAAAELNEDWSLSFGTQINNALGVCQIKPQTLAMIVENQGDPRETYIKWWDLPVDKDQRRREYEVNVEKKFESLDIVVKTDLFNLLRFPKSNIRMCGVLLRKLIDRQHRWPKIKGSVLFENKDALKIVATEFFIGGTLSPLPEDPSHVVTGEASPNNWGRQVVEQVMSIPVIALYFIDRNSDAAKAYGGYDLRRGDNDGVRRWGGEVRELPEGAANFVQQLQLDLKRLGFSSLVGSANGEFGPRTEWAVREFQIYSRMRFIAAEDPIGQELYLARLGRTTNVLPYSGPISGVLNVATRVAVKYWDSQNWRCPVVVQAYTGVPGSYGLISGMDNLWMPKDFDVASTSKYVRARDFTGNYEMPAEFDQDFEDIGSMIMVGYYNSGGSWGGPTSIFRHAWKGGHGAEVTPQALMGVNEQALGADVSDAATRKRSTFKVVRIVSEIENLGYFDSINCWDTAYLSLGICHWTIGRPGKAPAGGAEPNVEREGELAGYLAYLAQFENDAFYNSLGTFGVGIDKRWLDEEGNRTGGSLFKKTQRKYSGWLTLQQEDGSYLSVDDPPYKTTTDGNTEDVNCGHYYFKTWHWFYRFQMAARTVIPFRMRMWDFARIRIRDILTVAWGVPADNTKRITEDGKFIDRRGNVRNIEVGDVFTSEKAVGVLLRWHVNFPSHVIGFDANTDQTRPGERLLEAFGRAKLVAGTNFSRPLIEWEDAEEMALVHGLLETVQNLSATFNDLKSTINFVNHFPPQTLAEEYPPNVSSWKRSERGYQLDLAGLYFLPNESQQLKESRRSFRFDTSNFPNGLKTPYARSTSYYDWG